MLRHAILLGCVLFTGCSMLPEIAHQPTLHNPFPQLSKVAIAPFFNLSEEPTVNGEEVALAYYNELQLVPGFEVVPVGVVRDAMMKNNLRLDSPEDARRLAQLLEVDAVVVGAVTDFTPWYPPRCGLRVEWYSANPGFHPIPPGYGLPWGTTEEEQIPGPLVFEAEMALAKEQLKTQTPSYQPLAAKPKQIPTPEPKSSDALELPDWPDTPLDEPDTPLDEDDVNPLVYESPVDGQVVGATGIGDGAGLPENWPNPRGFIPPPPKPNPPSSIPSSAPVLAHTQTYNGDDSEFTEALASYYEFRDDARFGGWQSYLQRSDDFIRFCCHMHISEMLSARGGAGETRVVWKWPTIR